MKLLHYGDTGPSVELLQLALKRAGFMESAADGIFGPRTKYALTDFQAKNGLTADGIVGSVTHRALMPWYTGFTVYKVKKDDSFYSLASAFGCSVRAIMTANPGAVPENLQAGESLHIPLPFDVVPTDISCSSELLALCVQGLKGRYPFIGTGSIGKSVMGRPIWHLSLGKGENRVLYSAAHHANEWITALLLLKFTEQLASVSAFGGSLFGTAASEILDYASIAVIPAVNPDGIDLVTGELSSGPYFEAACSIAAVYPGYSFPSGWSANINGTDLNLQYPAGWEQAKAIKYARGIRSPAPGNFVGTHPLSAPESRALYDYTLLFDPKLILAYHTQGEVIYWRYLDYEPAGAAKIAEIFSQVSGYPAESTPYASGFAGYKDWFIEQYDRPGYTVEAGRGVNPLPISDFSGIYSKNLGILSLGALLT